MGSRSGRTHLQGLQPWTSALCSLTCPAFEPLRLDRWVPEDGRAANGGSYGGELAGGGAAPAWTPADIFGEFRRVPASSSASASASGSSSAAAPSTPQHGQPPPLDGITWTPPEWMRSAAQHFNEGMGQASTPHMPQQTSPERRALVN